MWEKKRRRANLAIQIETMFTTEDQSKRREHLLHGWALLHETSDSGSGRGHDFLTVDPGSECRGSALRAGGWALTDAPLLL
ncbi:unnamed protein product [Boreogadus saida]